LLVAHAFSVRLDVEADADDRTEMRLVADVMESLRASG